MAHKGCFAREEVFPPFLGSTAGSPRTPPKTLKKRVIPAPLTTDWVAGPRSLHNGIYPLLLEDRIPDPAPFRRRPTLFPRFEILEFVIHFVAGHGQGFSPPPPYSQQLFLATGSWTVKEGPGSIHSLRLPPQCWLGHRRTGEGWI